MKRVLMCSGKVYYDLAKARAEKGLQSDIAIIRFEQVRAAPLAVDSGSAPCSGSTAGWRPEGPKVQSRSRGSNAAGCRVPP